MKTIDRPPLSARFDRFLRWFFSASPDDNVALQPPTSVEPRSRAVAHRKPTRLRPHHSGPVRVVVKAKQ